MEIAKESIAETLRKFFLFKDGPLFSVYKGSDSLWGPQIRARKIGFIHLVEKMLSGVQNVVKTFYFTENQTSRKNTRLDFRKY